MKITDLKMIHIKPRWMFLKVETDEGVCGWGEPVLEGSSRVVEQAVTEPLRIRKLLMHKSEIRRLLGKIREKGYTIMPLQVYLKNSLVKVEIGLARGKKLYDKREDIRKKDIRREAERDFKQKI